MDDGITKLEDFFCFTPMLKKVTTGEEFKDIMLPRNGDYLIEEVTPADKPQTQLKQ